MVERCWFSFIVSDAAQVLMYNDAVDEVAADVVEKMEWRLEFSWMLLVPKDEITIIVS